MEAARQADVCRQIDSLGREADALQQAAAREHARQPHPQAGSAAGIGEERGAERSQQAVEAAGQRDLEQVALLSEPARLKAAARELGAAVIARSEERRVGKEGARKGRTRGAR